MASTTACTRTVTKNVHTQNTVVRGRAVNARATVKAAPARNARVVCEASSKKTLARAARNAALSLAAAATIAFPSITPIAEAYELNQAYGDMARLTAGDPIKNPYALLRNALPIKNKTIRQIQGNLESISEDLRVPGVRFSGVSKAVNTALNVVTKDSAKIIASVAPSKLEETKVLVDQLKSGLSDFKIVVDNKDKQQVPILQQELLGIVGQIEENMIDQFPFEIPAEYTNMPLLKGRAEVEMKVKYLENPKAKAATMHIVIDGYNAPVTAGNFIDLVQRKFYDNMIIDRSDGFVVQMGDPVGPQLGFVDPATNKLRTVPLEIMVPGDKLPVYGETLEELGRSNVDPTLPFNAYGTLAMARSEFENDSASSQIFFLLKESELTPSGANLLDGRYAVFGYITENPEGLEALKVGDIIESIKVTKGLNNLSNSSVSSKALEAAKETAKEAAKANSDALLLAGDA